MELCVEADGKEYGFASCKAQAEQMQKVMEKSERRHTSKKCAHCDKMDEAGEKETSWKIKIIKVAQNALDASNGNAIECIIGRGN